MNNISTKSNHLKGFNLIKESFIMALKAMQAHKMRTLLTMLGIIIGIVSVVLVNALGEGSRNQILQDISEMGTNTIDIYAGEGFGDRKAGAIRTLNINDVRALSKLSYVRSVTPQVSTSAIARRGNIEKSASIEGVGRGYFDVRGEKLAAGLFFDKSGEDSLALDAVIDDATKKAFFKDDENPLGQIIILGKVPVRVIGVTVPKKNSFGISGSLRIWLPYTSVMGRFTGSNQLQAITVRLLDGAPADKVENEIKNTLIQLHGAKDFFTHNSDSIRQTIEKTTLILQLFISSIAVIALIVGGIGVMNIMLVSVTERTGEIGIRMAVGARRFDIMSQFLIEAVLVCVTSGLIGIALALGIGAIIQSFLDSFRLIFSAQSIAIAVICSTSIGLVFGFLPARRAAGLDPVQALFQSS